MAINIQRTFAEFRNMAGANYLIEETISSERPKYNQLRAADGNDDQSVSFYEYLEYLSRTNPQLKIEFKYLEMASAIDAMKNMSIREDWRVSAAKHLSEPQVRDPITLPALYDCFDDSSLSVRVEAIRTIGIIGQPSSVAKLLPLLSSPEGSVRAAAAEALGEIGSLEGIAGALLIQIRQNLLNLCADAEWRVSDSATSALEKTGIDLINVPALAELIKNPKQPQRFRLMALFENLPYDKVEAIYREAIKDPDPAMRETVLKIMVRHSDSKVRQILIHTAVYDRDAGLRRQALEMLRAGIKPEEKRVFLDALKDPNPMVRKEALKALAVLGDDSETAMLIDVIGTDTDQYVRAQAKESYDQIMQRLRARPVYRD